MVLEKTEYLKEEEFFYACDFIDRVHVYENYNKMYLNLSELVLRDYQGFRFWRFDFRLNLIDMEFYLWEVLKDCSFGRDFRAFLSC